MEFRKLYLNDKFIFHLAQLIQILVTVVDIYVNFHRRCSIAPRNTKNMQPKKETLETHFNGSFVYFKQIMIFKYAYLTWFCISLWLDDKISKSWWQFENYYMGYSKNSFQLH